MTTVPGRLVDALREVTDLDALHDLLSNEFVDHFSSPQFSGWMVALINEERRRRETGEAETDYTLHAFHQWPPSYLIQAAMLTRSIAEAAAIVGEPTIQAFAWQLLDLLLGSMALALLNATIGNNERQNTNG